MSLDKPNYGFLEKEYEQRTLNIQRLMRESELDALLLTTEPEVRYFSGFQTPFWQSPTRPWFLIIPAEGKPAAIIPEIGANRMSSTWIDEVITWPSPRPDDEGITEISQFFYKLKTKYGRVGTPMGPETIVRMPLSDFNRLVQKMEQTQFVDASPLIRNLRMVKSEAEIDKLRFICKCVSKSFSNMKSMANLGNVEREIFRRVKIDLLSNGADEVPYLVGGSGFGGPLEVIGPPTERVVQKGDVLMMDTGSVFDGYYSDFDRNFAFGYAGDDVRKAYNTAFKATEVGINLARPGITAEQLWIEMSRVLEDGGSEGNTVGRLGHGLGMQLTEWPSHMKGDKTKLLAGMVITIEPSIKFGENRIMVHEENIVIRDGPAELLSDRASEEIPVLD